MRDRKANEKAINNTCDFLDDLQAKCEGNEDYKRITISDLHLLHRISNSTFSACKTLGIVKETKDGLEWLKENPNREMVLQVLDYLLNSRKKRKDIALPGLADFTNAINKSIEAMNKNTFEINNALRVTKIPQKTTGLFDEQDTKERQRFEMAKAIATGIYNYAFKFIQSPDDTASIQDTNQFILTATDNLLSLLNKK